MTLLILNFQIEKELFEKEEKVIDDIVKGPIPIEPIIERRMSFLKDQKNFKRSSTTMGIPELKKAKDEIKRLEAELSSEEMAIVRGLRDEVEEYKERITELEGEVEKLNAEMEEMTVRGVKPGSKRGSKDSRGGGDCDP